MNLPGLSPRQFRQDMPRQSGYGGRYSTWNKYYSAIRFPFAVTGTSGVAHTYTVNQGTEFRAFGYAIGQDISPAGFPTGTSATLAQTNLQKASETISGETVQIYGIAALLTSDSDAKLAKLLWPKLSVVLSLNGDLLTFKLGTPELIPCAGGLFGAGDTYVETPSQLETLNSQSGVISNGFPHVSNFYPFPQPVIWKPAGNEDSSLIVKVKAESTVTYTAPSADRAAVAAGSGTSGAAAWVQPTGTGLGTYVEIKFHLLSRQDGPRSQNA